MTHRIFIAFIIVGTSSGCSSTPLNESQGIEATAAVKSNDLSELKKIVGEKENGSFQYSCLAQEALDSSAHDHKCRGDILQFLVQKGATFTEAPADDFHKTGLGSIINTPNANYVGCNRQFNFTFALNSSCGDMAKLVADGLDPITVANVEIDQMERTETPDTPALNFVPVNEKIISDTVEKLNAECKKHTEEHESCYTFHKLSEAKIKNEKFLSELQARKKEAEENKKANDAELEKQAKQDEYDASPEGRSCKLINTIRLADQMIAHEKTIGRETGVVSMSALHDAGQMKIFAKKELGEIKLNYKKETRKELNLRNCKLDPSPY